MTWVLFVILDLLQVIGYSSNMKYRIVMCHKLQANFWKNKL